MTLEIFQYVKTWSHRNDNALQDFVHITYQTRKTIADVSEESAAIEHIFEQMKNRGLRILSIKHSDYENITIIRYYLEN